jgi:hypothetical protein
VYTPEHAYTRGDRLTFTASDGTQESAEAVVTFSFIAVDDLPVGRTMSVWLAEDDESGARIVLDGSDIDSAFVTFVVTKLPNKGKLYTVDRTGRAATLISAPFMQFSVSSHAHTGLVRTSHEMRHATIHEYAARSVEHIVALRSRGGSGSLR